MSFAKSVSPPWQSGRRFHARRRMGRLAYVDFGSDNGAILIDLGEGGLGFESVIPVSLDRALLLKFKVPGESNHIEVFAEVAWVNESRKGGGLHFVELSADACAQIRGWIGVLSAPEAVAPKAGKGADSNSAQESPAPERVKDGDLPAQISEAFTPGENVRPPSPEPDRALHATEAADDQVPAGQGILPGASAAPEFASEAAATADSTESLVSEAPPAAPSVFTTSAADTGASESALPASSATEWEKPWASPGDELKPQATMASQALNIGIAAAAGACLMLALVFGVPSLLTRVQATANTRSGGPSLARSPAFQVEVADLDNRRWILSNGGEPASPFNDTPSRRETRPAAPGRSESAKSSRSEDSGHSSNTVQAPQPKQPRLGELVLSRPHATQAGEPSALLVAPSIFDGITPPIGSVSDRLAASGPEAPGIVQPEVRSATRASALQAAVIVQRVEPIYPIDALRSNVEGDVLVNATIGTDGVPRNLKVIKGDGRLRLAALTAIPQWRYRPATLAGQPIETQVDVTVRFAVK